MAFTAKAKVDKRQAIAMVRGGLSQTEVAKVYGVTRDAISKLILRTQENDAELQTFRANKDKIMENIQAELLSAVDRDNPKEAQSLVVSAGILDDKIRLERGQATSYSIIDLRALLAIVPDQPTNV